MGLGAMKGYKVGIGIGFRVWVIFPGSQEIKMVRVLIFPGSQVIKLVRCPLFPRFRGFIPSRYP